MIVFHKLEKIIMKISICDIRGEKKSNLLQRFRITIFFLFHFTIKITRGNDSIR